MKKVFMSVAVVALMVAASACGNKAKKSEAVETRLLLLKRPLLAVAIQPLAATQQKDTAIQ